MYDTFSADYDRFVNWPSRLAYELPWLESQLQTVPDALRAQPMRVLDAACGTGKHAIALATLGYHTAGADLSAGMIDHARQNAQAAGVRVDFEATGFGDLARTFRGTGLFPFDALLCLGNSLPHLTSPQHLAASLADFAACLHPGGLLIIQNRNFDAVLESRQRWMEPQTHREGDTEWLFLRFYDFLPNDLLNFQIVTLRRQGEAAWQQSVVTNRLRPLRHAELVDALIAAGFKSIQAYGSMAGDPFDAATSANLIVTAVK